MQNVRVHDQLGIDRQYKLEVLFSGMEVGMKTKLLTLESFHIRTDVTSDFYIKYIFNNKGE